jgi:flotillin
MIVGGRAIICPCIHKVQKLQLSTMTLIIESRKVYTAQGVPVSVTGVAQVKYADAKSGKLVMQF